jgi:hypothetical protein
MDWTDIGRQILEQLLPIMGALLAALAAVALQKLQKKLGYELSEKQEAMLMAQVRRGISYAEEKAAHAAKVVIDKDDRESAQQKAKWAAEIIEAKYPKLTSDEIDKLIKTELANMTGVGATANFNVGETYNLSAVDDM